MAKKTGRSKTATIRIRPENHAAAELVARATGRTVSSLLEYALELYILKNYPQAYEAGVKLVLKLDEAPTVRALTLPQVHEDELPPMTDEQYAAWFALSYIPDGVGCRMGPAVATTTCILAQEAYKPGDPAPEGYLAWHEWAETQHKAGLRQKACGKCGHLFYPQELSEEFVRWEATTSTGNIVKRIAPVCLTCKTAQHANHRLHHTLLEQINGPNNIGS